MKYKKLKILITVVLFFLFIWLIGGFLGFELYNFEKKMCGGGSDCNPGIVRVDSLPMMCAAYPCNSFEINFLVVGGYSSLALMLTIILIIIKKNKYVEFYE